MKISTKGRYAIRLMIDLAEHNNGEYITLMDIAERQEISEKYLESIVSILSKNNLLISLRGKGGGYKLAKDPESYTVGSILRLTEGSLAPVASSEAESNNRGRAPHYQTLEMWKGLNKLVNDYFDGITIADLVRESEYTDNYII